MILYLVPALNLFLLVEDCSLWHLHHHWLRVCLHELRFTEKKQSKKVAQRQEFVVRKIMDSSLDKGFHLPEAAWPHETGDQFCVWASDTLVTECNHAF